MAADAQALADIAGPAEALLARAREVLPPGARAALAPALGAAPEQQREDIIAGLRRVALSRTARAAPREEALALLAVPRWARDAARLTAGAVLETRESPWKLAVLALEIVESLDPEGAAVLALRRASWHATQPQQATDAAVRLALAAWHPAAAAALLDRGETEALLGLEPVRCEQAQGAVAAAVARDALAWMRLEPQPAELEALGACLGQNDLGALLEGVASEDYWHGLDSVLRGVLAHGGPIDVDMQERLLDTLFKGAVAAGDFFERAAFETWFYLDGLNSTAEEAADRMRARARTALCCFRLILEDQRRREWPAATLRTRAVFAAAGWLEGRRPATLAVPWRSKSCATEAAAVVAAAAPGGGDLQAALPAPRRATWAWVRERLGSDRWKTTEWQTTAALATVVLACDREALGGEEAVGHLLPMILPLVDSSADNVCAAGCRALRHLVDQMTVSELRWHAELVHSRLDRVVVSRRNESVLTEALPALLSVVDKAEARTDPSLEMHLALGDQLVSSLSLATEGHARTVFLNSLCELFAAIGEATIQFLPDLFPPLERAVGLGGRRNHALRLAGARLLCEVLERAEPCVAAHQQRFLALIARNRILLEGAYERTAEPELLAHREAERGTNARAFALLCAAVQPGSLDTDLERLRPHIQLAPPRAETA